MGTGPKDTYTLVHATYNTDEVSSLGGYSEVSKQLNYSGRFQKSEVFMLYTYIAESKAELWQAANLLPTWYTATNFRWHPFIDKY